MWFSMSLTEWFNNHINEFLFCFVLIGVAIPLYGFGFACDDILNSLVAGVISNAHTTLILFTKKIIIDWTHMGRFYPLAFSSTYSLFYYVGDNLILYNLIHWLGVMLALITSCVFLNKFIHSLNGCLLFCVLFLTCWTLSPNSPLVTWALLMPQVIILIMLSLINYINYMTSYKKRYCVYMSLCYVLSLLTYEVALVVPLIIVVFNFCCADSRISKKNWMAVFSVVLITLLYLTSITVLRYVYGTGYKGTALGNMGKAPITFIKQLLGELPLMHAHQASVSISFIYYIVGFLLFVVSSYLVFRLLKTTLSIKYKKQLLLVSIFFQLTPAIMIAVSEKYQHELVFGASHIPVMLQQLGFCLLLILFIQTLLLHARHSSNQIFFYARLILALLIGAILSCSLIINEKTAEQWNEVSRYSRDIYEEAIKQGLFNGLPHSAIILHQFSGTELIWNSTQLRAQLIDRGDLLMFDGHCRAPDVDVDKEPICQSRMVELMSEVYYLDIEHLQQSPQAGYVLLGHVLHRNVFDQQVSLKIKPIKLFYVARNQRDLNQLIEMIELKYHLNMANQVKLANRPQDSQLSGFLTLNEPIVSEVFLY